MLQFEISGLPRNSEDFSRKFEELIDVIRENAQPKFSFIAIANPDITLNSENEIAKVVDVIMMIFALALRGALGNSYDFKRKKRDVMSDIFEIELLAE